MAKEKPSRPRALFPSISNITSFTSLSRKRGLKRISFTYGQRLKIQIIQPRSPRHTFSKHRLIEIDCMVSNRNRIGGQRPIDEKRINSIISLVRISHQVKKFCALISLLKPFDSGFLPPADFLLKESCFKVLAKQPFPLPLFLT
jgi:hypothetical protein